MHSLLIIGCGSIGERHLRSFQTTGRTRATACDANPALLQSIESRYGVPGTGNWEEALASGRFDSVVICTPAQLHVPMAMRALQAGCHVLLEKPLSVSLAGVDELAKARDDSRRQLAVAYVYHVFPFLAAAREFLLGGELGPIKHITSTSGQAFQKMRPTHTLHYSQTYYRDRKTGGGAIQDALTHMANWVESIIGPTDSVLCDCAHQALAGVTVEDTVNVSARHGDVLVNYSLNQFQIPNETTVQFNTVRGSVKIEFHLQRWGIFRDGDRDWTWQTAAVPERDAHFIAQANLFLDLIDGKSTSLCSLEQAQQTLRFNLAALASAELGARVHCAKLHDHDRP